MNKQRATQQATQPTAQWSLNNESVVWLDRYEDSNGVWHVVVTNDPSHAYTWMLERDFNAQQTNH